MRVFAVFLVVLMASGCEPIKVVNTPIMADRFECLTLPSAGYVPGTILRVIVQDTEDTLSNRTTIAYQPFFPPKDLGSFADYHKTTDRGLSGTVAADNFRRLGYKGEFSVRLKYNVIVTAKQNNHLFINDGAIGDTVSELNKRVPEIYRESKYYIVKEALASDELLYTATPDIGASIEAELAAFDADADFSIDLAKGTREIRGDNKKLIACIVMEPLEISPNLYGPPKLIFIEGRHNASKTDYRQLTMPEVIFPPGLVDPDN